MEENKMDKAVIDTEVEKARAALKAEVEKYENMVVDGCDCSLCGSYREHAEAARAALANMTAEETATEGSATEETEARGNGFKINAAAVINAFTVS